jgi:TatD DNase family protein
VIAIDAHAHIDVGITTEALAALTPAAVLAVTRSPEDWPVVVGRSDPNVAWGLGCHPGNDRALRLFRSNLLEAAAERASFIGEIGLDARSPAPPDLQRKVLSNILSVATNHRLVSSVHSAGAAVAVLDCVQAVRASRVVLHWWRGSVSQTVRALNLGCYFSVNSAMSGSVIERLPRDRVITETDFPFTSRRDPTITEPGAVGSVEALLARAWGLNHDEIRSQLWATIREIDSPGGRLLAAVVD